MTLEVEKKFALCKMTTSTNREVAPNWEVAPARGGVQE